MKTRYFKIDWLVPFVGIAVVAGTLVAATAYRDLERKCQGAEALTVTLDRLYQDQKLSKALKAIHEGEAKEAAQRLDLLLCGDILRTDSELAFADAQTRAYAEDAFQRIARVRPKIPEGGMAGSGQECSEDQMAAQRILAGALATIQTAQAKQRGGVTGRD